MTTLDIKYRTSLESITFCKFKLTIGDKTLMLSFPQLLHLRNKVYTLCEPSHLEEIINTDNFVIVYAADMEHLLLLDVPDLLDIKDEITLFFTS